MKFKTNVASAAVAAALGMMAGSAQAVYLSETGTGQVLIYPYYTVQNGYDTYLSVVNTTNSAKAVKVRFLEGKASIEVLDFNLYLSPYDVWVATVTTTADGSGALLRTPDTSCTAPQITGDVAFRNGAYSQADSFENALTRTREGYVEMIEMGVPDSVALVNPPNPSRVFWQTFAWSVTHLTTTGKPADCQWVNDQWTANLNAGNVGNNLQVNAPIGGLIGTGTLINVPQGTDYSYDPTALDAFSTSRGNHTQPGNLLPSLASAAGVSTVIFPSAAGGQMALTTDWTTVTNTVTNAVSGLGSSGAGAGVDAINAVLIRGSVMNEYVLDSAINAGTDWVVTFPTKRMGVFVTTAFAPWVKSFGDLTTSPWFTDETLKADGTFDEKNWKACETVTFSVFDREESKKQGSVDFSPAPTIGNKLCKEANVITFKNSKVLGSLNLSMNVDNVFSNGWINLGLWAGNAANPDHSLKTPVQAAIVTNGPAGFVYDGLPVTGFAVQKYVNGNVGGVLSNYGGAYIHKYRRDYWFPVVSTVGSTTL
jgi:hypothetical protein